MEQKFTPRPFPTRHPHYDPRDPAADAVRHVRPPLTRRTSSVLGSWPSRSNERKISGKQETGEHRNDDQMPLTMEKQSVPQLIRTRAGQSTAGRYGTSREIELVDGISNYLIKHWFMPNRKFTGDCSWRAW
jgi:hypothetical protein